MTEFAILKCPYCGEPTAYAPKVATKCRSCNKPIKRENCFLIARCINATDASFMVRKIKEELARRRFGS